MPKRQSVYWTNRYGMLIAFRPKKQQHYNQSVLPNLDSLVQSKQAKGVIFVMNR